MANQKVWALSGPATQEVREIGAGFFCLAKFQARVVLCLVSFGRILLGVCFVAQPRWSERELGT